MGTFSTDLKHFLTESGHFQPDLPNKAKELAEFMGSIVAIVTSHAYINFPDTGIKCFQKKRGKLCGGSIRAGIAYNCELETISWDCEKCGSSGVITGWDGTLWDLDEAFFGENTQH